MFQESGDEFWTLLSMVINEELCPVDQVKAVSPQTWFHLQQPLLSRGSTTFGILIHFHPSIHPDFQHYYMQPSYFLNPPLTTHLFRIPPQTQTHRTKVYNKLERLYLCFKLTSFVFTAWMTCNIILCFPLN